MNEKINISIVTCFYNAEKYVKSFIEMIERQTYKNFELIIVNDGSTDDGAKIAKDFVNKYDNIKYIEQKNSGPGPARNLGLSYARGEYIYYMDIDDVILEDTLEKLMKITASEKFDIVTFNSINMNENLTEVLKSPYKSRSIKSGRYDATSFLKHTLKRKSFYVPVWLCLYKHSFLKEVNKKFLSIIHEDCVYTINHFLEAKSIYYYDVILHNRRIDNNSIMHKKISERRIEDTMVVMHNAEKLYNGIQDPELKKILKKWNYLCTTLSVSAIEDSQYTKKYRMKIFKYILNHKYMIDLKTLARMLLLFVR